REMSMKTDPQEVVEAYGERMQNYTGIEATVSLSRRDLDPPWFRITRSHLWTEDINPWKQKEKLPMLQGGMLGELLYGDEPALIEDFNADPSDPAYDHLKGFRTLLAVPHFDKGVGLNMVVHLFSRPNAFDREKLADFVLTSNLF